MPFLKAADFGALSVCSVIFINGARVIFLSMLSNAIVGNYQLFKAVIHKNVKRGYIKNYENIKQRNGASYQEEST